MLEPLLKKDLALVVCGSAAGTRSALKGQYYAGPGNKFWRTLHEVGLTGVQIDPAEYRTLLQYGIGLTDLVRDQAGSDNEIRFRRPHAARLSATIRKYRPGILCFNGKRAAEEYFGESVKYGLQAVSVGDTRVFVAPSTSGAANRSWDLSKWKEIARLVRLRPERA